MMRGGPRSAFSLLEVMLALALLGALMAVAWSLIGTFRNAEIRGWKLGHRTQIVRTARAWLENDMQHLVALPPGNNPAPSSPASVSFSQSRPSQRSTFTGDAMGFSATIEPSIDPIPFLENLMSDGAPVERTNPKREPLLEDASESERPSSPWPADTVDIEYQLTPMHSESFASATNGESTANDVQYVMIRKEMLDLGGQLSPTNPSERVLSTQDLYRQTEDTVGRSLDRAVARESRLEGLTHVRFRYYDGQTWKSDWNSSQSGSLPRAIALGFDFPPNAEMQSAPSVKSRNRDTEELLKNELDSNPLLRTDSELVPEAPTGANASTQESIMESSTNEYQIVVFVSRGSTPTNVPAAPMQRVGP